MCVLCVVEKNGWLGWLVVVADDDDGIWCAFLF